MNEIDSKMSTCGTGLWKNNQWYAMCFKDGKKQEGWNFEWLVFNLCLLYKNTLFVHILILSHLRNQSIGLSFAPVLYRRHKF